ncbi:creatininase family protein [Micromonospora sp. WMMD1082]|uniref:creatininase family protein n=1 Tax=Micromonospora sp. WMMD1082 TaxID=3016104 RepID=UPI002416B428|nr:creatininase family protein [Micromonospora sp. WMMD1082]MDG4793479.1 creatininase family protein [Micromonospora sp. WMMD1082]
MNRWFGSLPAPEICTRLTETSILCLPIGSYEQHGPHLPLHTDTVIAEQFTNRLIDRYGDQYDLWALPVLPYGLSLEHAWSPGTISLRIGALTTLLDTIVGELVRATPARRLLIVNGHGGNRSILDAVGYELRATHQVRVCTVHPSSLSAVRVTSALPEIHAGMKETSMMLALAPHAVYLDRLPETFTVNLAHGDEIQRLILDRGATWSWNSGDARIATFGITGGDPRLASADLGEDIITSALDASDQILQQL